ncbi:MAG: dihydropteroate synthase [Candidatus Omnitrophica bacterium]|nr:dihydropteroate synthase [Candidatus Omnitrophota bacterium]
MLVIGELINGMYKAAGNAIKKREKSVIQKLAKDQVTAGAGVLDVNTGPASIEPKSDMKWLVETIQEVLDIPLALDSTKADVIEEGLKVVKRKAFINSINADDDKLNTLIPIAKKYKAQLIGLAMDKRGIPRDRIQRSELALKIVSSCIEKEFPIEDLYIDPVVLPVNVAQAQGVEVLESIREFKLLCDPPPKTVVGLSNISQGTKKRSLINRTFLVMAASCGLSAAILDPLDSELMDALITAELLLNQHIYCDSYLDAYRKK